MLTAQFDRNMIRTKTYRSHMHTVSNVLKYMDYLYMLLICFTLPVWLGIVVVRASDLRSTGSAPGRRIVCRQHSEQLAHTGVHRLGSYDSMSL